MLDFSLDECNRLIDRLVGQTAHGLQKTATLYALAQAAKGGAIVEVGTYLGIGLIALGFGTQTGHACPLYAVDDYAEKDGWTPGEHYTPHDLTRFLIHMGEAGLRPTLVRQECRAAAATWPHGPIALLVWDVAQFNRLARDFAAWAPRIMPGGGVALRDIDDFRFGAREVGRAAVDSGRWTDYQEQPGFFVTVRKG